MKAFTWFLLFTLAVIGASLYYFYQYVYIPRNALISRLEDENLSLKYEVTDELNRLYSKNHTVSNNMDTTTSNADNSIKNAKKDSIVSHKIEPVSFAFSIKDVFQKSGLSLKGKALISEFYNQIEGKKFDSIRILINRRNSQAARKVLNIKKYLVKLGLDKKKVWARLDRKVSRDSVYFKIIW